MSTASIRVTYGVVFALLVAFTIIFGIAMVAPGPKPPADPNITFRQLSQAGGDDNERSQNQLTQQIDQVYGDAARYRNEYPAHQRNVFLASTGLAVFVILVGLALPAIVNYLRFGLLLGGIFVLIYGFTIAIRGVPDVTPQAQSFFGLLSIGYAEQLNFAGRFLMFAIAFIGLILTLFLGLWRLTEWPSAQRRVAVAAVPAAAPVAAAASQWAPPSAPPPPAPVATTVAAPAPAAAGTLPAEPAPVEAATTEWRRPE